MTKDFYFIQEEPFQYNDTIVWRSESFWPYIGSEKEFRPKFVNTFHHRPTLLERLVSAINAIKGISTPSRTLQL